MTAIRKIHICVPDNLLAEMDFLVQAERKNRSALVREAVRQYLRESGRHRLLREMREGYVSMGDVNRDLAEEAASADHAVWEEYEKRLAEAWGAPEDAFSKAQG